MAKGKPDNPEQGDSQGRQSGYGAAEYGQEIEVYLAQSGVGIPPSHTEPVESPGGAAKEYPAQTGTDASAPEAA